MLGSGVKTYHLSILESSILCGYLIECRQLEKFEKCMIFLHVYTFQKNAHHCKSVCTFSKRTCTITKSCVLFQKGTNLAAWSSRTLESCNR